MSDVDVVQNKIVVIPEHGVGEGVEVKEEPNDGKGEDEMFGFKFGEAMKHEKII